MNFIQQAYKGKNEWYHWLVTVILVVLGWQILGAIPLVLVAAASSGDMNTFFEAAQNNFTTLGINKSLLLTLVIITFMCGLLFLLVGVKYVHKRSITSLVTSRKKIDWKRFWFGFLVWGTISALLIYAAILISPENYVYNFKPKPFVILLAVSLLLLPFQTSFEELLFRGYFMQGLGTLAKNRWVPLVVTSVVFGLMHLANPEVQKLGYTTMVFYIGTGFLFGITTLMDEGTELALGLHAINNIIAAFFVTAEWTAFQTDALYIDISEPTADWQMFIPVFVFYPLMLLLFANKYGWSNWKEKLAGKIEKPILAENDSF